MIGRINKIAQMSERDLYNLLQEIIGTNQYEAKKIESIRTFDQISNLCPNNISNIFYR